jgi:hypothetical protein
VEATREDHGDLARDRGRQLGRRPPARSTRHRRVGGVEQDRVQVRSGAIGLRLRDELGRALAPGVGAGGREVDDLDHRQRDPVEIRRRLGARELDRIEAQPAGDRGDLVRVAVGEDSHQADLAKRAGVAGELDRLRPGECASRARYEVQADRIRSGGDRRAQALGLGDAADLDERATPVRGRVLCGTRHPAGRHQRGGARGDSGRIGAGAHQLLANQGGIESLGPPASQGRRVTDTRFGDREPVAWQG